MPVRNVQILILTMLVCIACYVQAERLKYAGKIGTAIQLIEQNYVEAIDPEELYMAAMDGMVSKLDQFSEFIPPAKYKEFQAVIEQQFGGLGVLIEGPPSAKRLTVIAPIPGTPAFKAGLQPGDMIVEIAGQSTEGVSATDATRLMRGPVGESIQLKVSRLGVAEAMIMDIKRADIQVDSVYGDRMLGDSTWNFFLEEDPRIAYIRVTLFGERTVEEFQRALRLIGKDAQALVIDLRYNPGGILPTAVTMCDMLVDEGVIVSTRGRDGILGIELKSKPGVELDTSIPVVVLVNDQSASASEIMAGCLQDLGRAKIGGGRSYGKGTVQQVFPLENDQTALKFTTARFYRPSGKNIHRVEKMTDQDEWGITPDAELAVPTTEIQDLYLNRRWHRRGDPRLTAAEERLPIPEFAGDPQLRRAATYLQQLLDRDNSAETRLEVEQVGS